MVLLFPYKSQSFSGLAETNVGDLCEFYDEDSMDNYEANNRIFFKKEMMTFKTNHFIIHDFDVFNVFCSR